MSPPNLTQITGNMRSPPGKESYDHQHRKLGPRHLPLRVNTVVQKSIKMGTDITKTKKVSQLTKGCTAS